ncbi:MAG: hypothetical protein ACXVLQ_08360 [Bacteriovorax sp.]
MMKSFLVLITFIASQALFALEIDERLTLRFLKVSNSKKTVLINRGAEDGLAIGDHAKFFITSGVVARGVVEKVSPSRSIWSLYRVIDPAEITDGKVLNLKIASPVKITADPSKSLKEEAPAGSEKMNMSEGEKAEKGAPALNEEDQKELEGMGIEGEKPAKKDSTKKEKAAPKEVSEASMEDVSTHVVSKNWEVWGTLYINALTGTVNNPSNVNASTGASASSVDYSAGIERYFLNSDSFLKNISVTAFVHKRATESDFLANQGIKTTSDWLEFGGGASYHFYNSASSTGRVIGFGSIDGGVGNTSSNETITQPGGAELSTPMKGTDTFFILGVGAKYVLTNGFGMRATLDYYHANESYTVSGTTSDTTVTRTLSGPRVQFGLSYRF